MRKKNTQNFPEEKEQCRNQRQTVICLMTHGVNHQLPDKKSFYVAMLLYVEGVRPVASLFMYHIKGGGTKEAW